MTAPSRGRLIGGLLLGTLAGCFVGSVATAPFAYVSGKKKMAPTRRAWGLTPVVVYGEPFTGTDAVTFDHISQRSFPAHTVDDGMVKPDEAAQLIGRHVIGRMKANAPVRWVDLAPKEAAHCFKP